MNANRAGKTLIELSVVIALLSVVLTLATRTIVSLMHADAAGRKAVVNGTSFSRLADRFRRDAHAAVKAELLPGDNNGPQRLRLTQADGRAIEYHPQVGRVHVVVLRGKQRHGRETYRLNGGATRFEIAAEKPTLVSLLYETGGDAPPERPAAGRRRKTLRIDALRGKDHRFSQQGN
ncbi:MAG: type II secretion system protein [Planctomycetaceae bacterium]